MKRNINIAAAVLMSGLIMAGSIGYAQNNPVVLNLKNKSAIENLKTGIKSNNYGLKRSSIYYAGYYRIADALPALTETVKKEQDPKTRILIALVLYKIGEEKGINLVKEMADKDKDNEVRRMCTCIYNAYIGGNSEIAGLTGLD
jgi:HEAT repeat protein